MKTYHVMVIDDDAVIRHMLHMLLELEGYQITEAEDGVDALQKINEDQPDAIILDVMMPNMDGITLCKKLRARAETAVMPIIMISGKTKDGAAEDGLAAGAQMYMKKPMDMKKLLVALRGYLQGVEQIM